MQAFDAKAVKKTHLSDIWDQWKEPKHDEFKQDKNVWRLMNAVTEVQRGVNPFELQARTQRLHPLLDIASGVAIGARKLAQQLDANIVDAEFTVRGEEIL
jgi:hypothetical protein